ncbi:hypothetical protein E4U19_000193, partial [Claviceps sp. Clav32 group G5]
MNLVHVLNPPNEVTPQIPRGLEDHVTPSQTPISPYAGYAPMDSAELEWPFQDNSPSANQLAPILSEELPELPTTDWIDIGPLEELEYSILSPLTDVDFTVESKLGTKKAQERRKQNAEASQRS